MKVTIPSPSKRKFSDLKVLSPSKAVSTRRVMKLMAYNIVDNSLAVAFAIKEGDVNHEPFLYPVLAAIQSGMGPTGISNPVVDAGFFANLVRVTSANNDIPLRSRCGYDFKCFAAQHEDFTTDNFRPLKNLLETLMNVSLCVTILRMYVYTYLTFPSG